MARATLVKKARADIPQDKCGIEGGIKAGESYYWWKFRFGGKRYNKTPPRRSQLTQSEFYGTLWDIEDRIADAVADDSLPEELRDCAEQLRNLASECEDKHGNMPDSLQDSDTGTMLQERADACNSAADELESLADGMDVADKDDDQTPADYWEAQREEAQAVSIDAP